MVELEAGVNVVNILVSLKKLMGHTTWWTLCPTWENGA